MSNERKVINKNYRSLPAMSFKENYAKKGLFSCD